LSPILTLVVLLCLPLLLAVATRLRARMFPASWHAQQRQAEVAGVVEEAVSGVRIVKAFGQEQRELDKLVARARDLYRSRVRMARVQARYNPTMQAIPTFGQLGVFALGGWLVMRSSISIGTFVAFSSYLVQMV